MLARITVVVALVVALAPAAPASAHSVSCGADTLIWLQGEDTVSLERVHANDADWLDVSTASGSMAARCRLDQIDAVIVLTGSPQGTPPPDSAPQKVVLDLGGGPFEPGATPEENGISEIEFTINLGAGDDVVEIRGTGGDDDLRFGTDGIALNGDKDEDVVIAAVERVRMVGRGGADRLDATGGHGSGDDATIPVTLVGGPGPDLLRGSAVALDSLYGKSGRDRFNARDGETDSVFGGRGRDVARIDDGVDDASSIAVFR